ncbi:MAG: helix-turn-helix domain-containing protein [Pelagimonas sp.]|jgi:hypothetical protein|nr:helix-turn-helix domain-containing protein [Pelagimonas sp.]
MTDLPEISYPAHPAHLTPYVEELGAALAVRFLLKFGGPSIYFPNDPKGKSEAEAMVGPERLKALGARMKSNNQRIPTARTWLIHALKAEGCTVYEICRRVHLSDVQVRKNLKLCPKGSAAPVESDQDDGQLSLF